MHCTTIPEFRQSGLQFGVSDKKNFDTDIYFRSYESTYKETDTLSPETYNTEYFNRGLKRAHDLSPVSYPIHP